MKDFSSIDDDQLQERTKFEPLEKKSILFKLKSVMELPNILKKAYRYKLAEKVKSPTINLKDGNIISFLSTNQNRNEHEKLTFVEARTDIQFHTKFQWINITRKPRITQNLIDTGSIGGFEYWDGKRVDLPN